MNTEQNITEDFSEFKKIDDLIEGAEIYNNLPPAMVI